MDYGNRWLSVKPRYYIKYDTYISITWKWLRKKLRFGSPYVDNTALLFGVGQPLCLIIIIIMIIIINNDNNIKNDFSYKL